MTMMFLRIILGATDKWTQPGFAPIAIGLGLTLIHLISIPVTNTSANPARSTGVALFVGDWAVGKLWLFWVAQMIGAVLGALIYRFIGEDEVKNQAWQNAQAELCEKAAQPDWLNVRYSSQWPPRR